MMNEPIEKTLSSLAVTPFSAGVSKAASSHALAQQRYNQAIELENQLRNLLQTKGSFDFHVRDLRSSIRECYEVVILEDHEFAESHDVEQALWRLHYKQIEEFRARIRKSAAAAAASAPVIPMPGAKPVPRRELLQKVLAAFKSLLSEATGFYHELILKLRGKYGLPQDYLSYENPVSGYGETKSAEVIRCQLSCHRCLIFLGDLARYKECHGDGDLRSHDWSVAANYYLKAISLWPSGGNPHNQLAVLATYVNDDLLAVYRYFRSLAVDSPFLTARDNLILLFEKNRQHYAHLSAHTDETTVPVLKHEASKVAEKLKPGDKMLSVGNGVLKLAVKDYNQQSAESKGLPTFISEIRRNFRVRFVRLNGILFTRTSLETFPDVYSATIRDLEQLLSPDDSILEAGLGSEHRSGIGTGSSGAAGVVQLVAILIFTVHNVNWGSNAVQPTYADVLQRPALFEHAFTAAFECAGRIMRRCVDTSDASQNPLLPAMLVFMEWLACRPEMTLGSDIDEKQENARSFFWKQCVPLLNEFSNYDKEHSNLNGGLEAPFRTDPLDGFRANEGAFALWEDYELQGFVPLAPAHVTLDYSKRPSRLLLGDKREQRVRIKRLIAAGKAISSALVGSGRGIFFDEDARKFFLAGEVISSGKVTSLDVDNMNGHLTFEVGTLSEGYASSKFRLSDNVTKESLEFIVPKEHSKQMSPKVLPAMQTPGEEEEEMIVFKPLLKEGSLRVPLSSSKSTEGSVEVLVGPIDPVKSATRILPSSSGDGRALDAYKERMQLASCEIGNLAPAASNVQYDKGIMGPLQASLNGFSPLALSTSSLLETLSTSLDITNEGLSITKETDSTGMSEDHSSLAGAISAQDWLNCTREATSPGFTNVPFGNWGLHANSSMFANGLTKMPGLIGQAKQAGTYNQHWSTAPDVSTNSFSGISAIPRPLSTHSSSVMPGAQVRKPVKDATPLNVLPEVPTETFVNGDSYKKPQNGVISSPYSSMLEALANMTGANVVDSEKEGRILESAAGYRSVDSGIEGKILQSGGGYSSASPGQVGSSMWISKENSPSSWLGPVIRPPPGFGPLPMKSVAKVIEFPQSSQREIENQHMVDMEQQQQVDDYTWLDDYKPSKSEPNKGGCQDALSDYGIWSGSNIGGALPFPGMRPSQFRNTSEQQKQNIAAQLQQQFLFEQQNKNLGLGLEQLPCLYGRQQLLGDGQDQTYAQQLLLQQQQQQQQQQIWYGHHTNDPFVS